MRVNDSDRLYPKFWLGVSPNFNRAYNDFVKNLKIKKKKGEILTEEETHALGDLNKINDGLICPMNYVYNYKFEKNRSEESTLSMDYFFQKYKLEDNRRKNKKVEELIEEYSRDLSEYYKDIQDKSLELSDAITVGNFLEEDLEELITKIRGLYLNSSYIGLTSWLIDRAFCITPNSKMGAPHSNRTTDKNKSLLLKVLYDINPQNVVKCFSKNLGK